MKELNEMDKELIREAIETHIKSLPLEDREEVGIRYGLLMKDLGVVE